MKSFREIEGYLYLTEGLILRDLARNRVCLEIGSYLGKSTVAIAKFAKKVIAIDTFRGVEPYQRQLDSYTTLKGFLENIKGYKNIQFQVGNSLDILPRIGESFNFVFLDGSHNYETVKKEISLILPILQKDSILAFHDYTSNQYPGVKQAVDEVFGPLKETHKLMGWIRL